MGDRTCYYPNGDPAKSNDIPCGNGDGVMCCPEGWSCRDNGLCYLANENYLGRYTCTDRTWQSPGCANICLYDKTASGNEAIQECSQNRYCCDTNRPPRSCCETQDTFFSLGNRKVAETIGAPSPSATENPSSDEDDSSTSEEDSSTSEEDSSTREESSTTLRTITASSSRTVFRTSSITSEITSSDTPSTIDGGGTSVVLVTSVIAENSGESRTSVMTSPATAEAASESTSPATSGSDSGRADPAIIGPAVAVPVALIILAILALLYIRRRKKRRPQQPPMSSAGYNAEPMYKPPVLPSSPYANGKSELEGSSPNLASLSPATATYQSPDDVGGTASSTGSPSSHLRGVSGTSGMSSGRNSLQPGDPQYVPELPGTAVQRENSRRRLSELPERPYME